MNKNLTYFMYILQNGDTNQYKIGRTGNLNKRLAQLQTGCPEELKIVKLYSHYQEKSVKRYERVLHRYFTQAGCRIRKNGEWFELRQVDLNFLCKPNSIAEQNELVDTLCKMTNGEWV